MHKKDPSLCVPDLEKSCFACCPPIRPSGYEHIQYKNIMKRMLRENTSSFQPKESPITGFSCWALGYIDKSFKRIGCLLHPEQNKGIDLRDLTGYGEKCRRESCLEARIFERLEYKTRLFWLQFTNGLNSFSYSSRVFNPIFRLLRWGKEVLEYIAKKENYARISLNLLEEKYPFLKSRIDPRGIAYPVKFALKTGRVMGSGEIERIIKRMKKQYAFYMSPKPEDLSKSIYTYVHILDMDRDFLDFLRLGLLIKKMVPNMALMIKDNIDHMLSEMRVSLYS